MEMKENLVVLHVSNELHSGGKLVKLILGTNFFLEKYNFFKVGLSATNNSI